MAEQAINSTKVRNLVSGSLWPNFPPDRLEFLLKLIQDEELYQPRNLANLERAAIINNHYRACSKLPRLIQQHGLTTTDLEVIFYHGPGSNAFWLHYLLFLPTLKMLGSDEQVAKWVGPANNLELFGSYCQTELAHGSDVQNLQTLATYDKQRKVFDIHSPSIHAMKWWPGALGLCATHAVLMARLVIEEADYGVHPFIVRIRDSQSFEPIPGVSVGDLGPKMGLDYSDNGYLRFDHVTVPRDSLLSRYFEVTEEGDYILKNADAAKHIYSGVVFARIGLTKISPYALATSLSFAMKYSSMRTQFRTLPDTPTKERPILDYQLQQHKLFPLLATTYAMYFGHKRLCLLHRRNAQLVEQEDFSLLKDVHILASCYKLWFTWWSSHGMEECRKACGGHGFSKYATLSHMYAAMLSANTLDGDNVVLTFQVSKALCKAFDHALKGKLNTGLLDCIENQPFQPISPQRDSLSTVMRAIVLSRVRILHAKSKALKCSEVEQWAQHLQIDSVGLSRSFCVWTLLKAFDEEVRETEDPTIQQTLMQLSKVFGIREVVRSASVLLAEQLMESAALVYYRRVYSDTIRALRPLCVAMSEASLFELRTFTSALDGIDGHPYERLLTVARDMNSVNESPVFPAIPKYLKPLAKL